MRHGKGSESFFDLMQIKKNIRRSKDLVGRLLAFSRGRTESNDTIISLNAVLSELSLLIRNLLNSDIELAINCDDDLFPVIFDAGLLEQIIVNLAVNARDSISGGGKLTVEAKNCTINKDFNEEGFFTPPGESSIAPGNYVRITVSDNGSGIRDTILDKIFEPFFSTKDASSGTGLGLSDVFSIVKEVGGHLRLITKEGKGTTFFIFLKAASKALVENRADALSEEESQVLSSADKDAPPRQAPVKSARILLVDDEDSIRLFGVYALRSCGYEVYEADSAKNALKNSSNCKTPIDLILTDVMMPDLSGIEFASQVNVLYPGTKFIFTSGYTEEGLAFSGAVKYSFLAKPYSLKELTVEVARILAI